MGYLQKKIRSAMLIVEFEKEKGSLGRGTADCLSVSCSLLVGRPGASTAIRGNQAADESFIRWRRWQ
jgi:hypothetical protein